MNDADVARFANAIGRLAARADAAGKADLEIIIDYVERLSRGDLLSNAAKSHCEDVTGIEAL